MCVQEEVDFLMSFFHERAKADLDEIMRNEIRLSVMGDKLKLPESLQSLISSAEEYTKANQGLHMFLALNYGGRYDITAASKKIATKVRDGVLQVEEINEALFEQHLETSEIQVSNPDLLIRTSGEHRVSNFMLWQLAYSELYFANKLFPDFDEDDFVEALKMFQKRHRRYGGGHNK
ncbi:hypothetical protein RD792_010414 [Penstemon davidsonii]|uniref:Alkyl transferase n=1 Tax=Penstemon davidsonii TaxID=160366 RepID=A0ABR0D2Y1_9LAMI|nr:hypothetical protein RD792_010414 [Penstemon davidsonii]